MVREQKLSHAALRFFNLFTLRRDDHAVSAGNRAGRLQLRHLLDADETHATRSLQREIGVITKGWNIETFFAAHVDQTLGLQNFEILTVKRNFSPSTLHLIFSYNLRCIFESLIASPTTQPFREG